VPSELRKLRENASILAWAVSRLFCTTTRAREVAPLGQL
jgi:hypothetical protein